MSGVSEADVRHIAALARVGLEADRVEQIARELNGILAHMDVLARIDTSRALPFTADGLEATPLRSDESAAAIPLLVPLPEIAPDMRDGFFLVPRLATHEDGAERHA